MNILAETHSHTNVSGHAYHTLGEMVAAARDKGLELISITNHGPAIEDGAHIWHFGNMIAIPHVIDGIYVLKGAEANIINLSGELDIGAQHAQRLDLVIASIHPGIFPAGTVEEHTQMYINVLRNHYVDIIGHCGTPSFEFDIPAVLAEAKKQNKIIEINNHTFHVRKQNIDNCKKIAKACAEMGVKVVASTDAHSIYELGDVSCSVDTIREAGIPEELVMNTTAERFLTHLCARRGFDRSRFENTGLHDN